MTYDVMTKFFPRCRLFKGTFAECESFIEQDRRDGGDWWNLTIEKTPSQKNKTLQVIGR